LGCLERVADADGVDSMLQFWLESGGDGMKHYRNMKQRQRAHLGSMERKRDTTRWCGDISQMRGGTREGKRRIQRQLDSCESYCIEKYKKINVINSVVTNRR
jgi:hypothetical protein